MSRPLRLLFVVGAFTTGGAERHLIELWRRLDRREFDVTVACFRREGGFLAEALAVGWPVVDLGVGRRIYDPRGFAAFARLLHLDRPAARLHHDAPLRRAFGGFLNGSELLASWLHVWYRC